MKFHMVKILASKLLVQKMTKSAAFASLLPPLLLSKLGSSHLQWEFFGPYIYLHFSSRVVGQKVVQVK